MKISEEKKRFIELRAQGLSFDKIAQELGKAKQTLVDWSRELSEEVASRRALELEALYESHYLTKEARLKKLGEILNRLTDELEGRDLANISTEKLLDLYLKFKDKVAQEFIEPDFWSTKRIERGREERNFRDKQPNYLF